MSKINVEYKDGIITIEKTRVRQTDNDFQKIDINTLEYKQNYKSTVIASTKKTYNKVFLIQELEGINDEGTKDAIIVYSKLGKIFYKKTTLEAAYKSVIKMPCKVLKTSISKKYLKITVFAYMINTYKQDIKEIKFSIDSNNYKKVNIKTYEQGTSKIKRLLENNIYNFKFKIEDLLNSNEEINNSIGFLLNINGNEVEYKLPMKDKKIVNKKRTPKYYYIPLNSKYIGNTALHLRRTMTGNLVLVKRLIEPIEKTLKFRFLESKIVSKILYDLGKLLSNKRKKNINIFYEKFASKSEEGVYELYKKCNESSNSNNYFVIDEDSPDYQRLKNDKNVLRKFSFKYYWKIYNASWFIASEVPGHLNILRSNNKYFRKATYDKKFVFLQHGIIYMKNLGVNSVFCKGKEGESQYFVVSSKKERDVVVDMLGYNEEELLNTGLAMYSDLDYNHIGDNSKDIVTIMLTWKPYEEHLYNFEESTYYKNTVDIYEILKKYVKTENIKVVAHPKVYDLLSKTDMKDAIWKKPISEVLKIGKLFITDYSSACYNAFYQGAAVLFYQPDLELYEIENGKLIPNDDEYIGKRALSRDELIEIIEKSITEGKINREMLRTQKQEELYKTINEHYDGKNTERIYEELKGKGIV